LAISERYWPFCQWLRGFGVTAPTEDDFGEECMFRYRLRTLLILALVGPPALAWMWWLGLTPIVAAVVL
jgi:hypothetical protein